MNLTNLQDFHGTIVYWNRLWTEVQKPDASSTSDSSSPKKLNLEKIQCKFTAENYWEYLIFKQFSVHPQLIAAKLYFCTIQARLSCISDATGETLLWLIGRASGSQNGERIREVSLFIFFSLLRSCTSMCRKKKSTTNREIKKWKKYD